MDEWKRGWRVVLGAMIGSGFGITLFYYSASLFSTPMMNEFGVSRGEFANVQALLILGALSAPFIGRLLDRYGFRWVFGVCTLLVAVGHLIVATLLSSLYAFAAVGLVYGLVGVGSGPLAYTRPIAAWFVQHRGLALGIAAIGPAVTASFMPAILADVIETHGWRAGYLLLAGAAALVSLPAAVLLVRDAPDASQSAPIASPHDRVGPRSYYRERDFWLMAAALICMSIPGAGLLSQISPLVQAEGIGAIAAALAVSAYAVGQVTGRIVAGWSLDRLSPRIVAVFFTLVPATGFILLAMTDLPFWLAIGAVGLVGIQQGAEIDLFAYFTARRFGIERYGQVYGAITASGWIGNAGGILIFGWLFTAYGSYAIAELIAAGLLAIGALLIGIVRINPPVTS